ncbi:MAG TPA: hypothetical protein VFB38_22315 [Chthonomonadaceae bacterium]|nr:hypothetical protein [Chthonomonadaceae bacterium]
MSKGQEQVRSQSQPWTGMLLLGGQRVEPGRYRQLGTEREVRLEQADYLPASLNGRVALYERVAFSWSRRSATVLGIREDADATLLVQW